MRKVAAPPNGRGRGWQDGGVSGGSRPAAQPSDLRRQNLSALVNSVVTAGSIARAELAAATGLTPGTVTKLTAALTEVGLLRELDSPTSPRSPGRPRIPVAMDDRRFRVAGIHIGYLRTTACLVDLNGRLIDETRPKHSSLRFESVLAQAVRSLQDLQDKHGGELLGVGVSTGGWVDDQSGISIEQPVLGWKDAPIRPALQERLGLPVRVDASVRALALAETWLGARKNVRNLLHIFVGNVVGAGCVIDGRVYRGSRSSAGMLDHLPMGSKARHPCTCGRRDCLRVVAGDVALVDQAKQSGLLTAKGTVEDLIALARKGNHRADSLLGNRARHVGAAAATLIDLFDPEIVVVGGGVVDAEEYLPAVRDGVRARLASHRPFDVDSQVMTSSFGTHAISISAAAVMLAEIYQDPTQFVPQLNEIRYG